MSYDNDFYVSLNEVISYIEMGRYKQAMDKLLQLLSQDPNNGELLYLMAYCCYNIDSYEEAIEYCTESLENGFSAERCFYLLGRLYMDIEQFSKSEEYFLESLRINPEEASVLAAYGMLMLKTGHEKKSEKLLDEAMRIDPENVTVLRYKFIYYLCKGNKNSQIDLLEKYLISASNEVGKLMNIAVYNLHNDNYSEARENIRQAFLLDPTNEDILKILEGLDKQNHWVFLPNRLIDKLGGPAVVWVIFFPLAIVGKQVLNPIVFAAIAFSYILLALYTWVSPLIYKAIIKFK